MWCFAGRAHLQIIEDSSSVGLKIELLFFAYEPPKRNSSLLDIYLIEVDILQKRETKNYSLQLYAKLIYNKTVHSFITCVEN